MQETEQVEAKQVVYSSPMEERICLALLKHPEGMQAQAIADEIGFQRQTILEYITSNRFRDSLLKRKILTVVSVPRPYQDRKCIVPHPHTNGDAPTMVLEVVGRRGRPARIFSLSDWARADLERDVP